MGAYTVMNNTEFTIGMLVAFQNVGCGDEGTASFAIDAVRKLTTSYRLVGLWQQFQQALIYSENHLADLPPPLAVGLK